MTMTLRPTFYRRYRYEDARGDFSVLYAQRPGFNAIQANHSRSICRTVRGLHWQWRQPQSKQITVIRGRIYDVVVDVRANSPTFRKWEAFTLDGDDGGALVVPSGFAHGFCVLSDEAHVVYFVDDLYDPEGEAGLPWNDPTLGISWPVAPDLAILSDRDRAWPTFTEQFDRTPHLFR